MAEADRKHRRARPPDKPPTDWPRNDHHNHGSNAAYVRVDWDKLTRDAALQAGRDGEEWETDEHARSR
jgi:hypothetical protein